MRDHLIQRVTESFLPQRCVYGDNSDIASKATLTKEKSTISLFVLVFPGLWLPIFVLFI